MELTEEMKKELAELIADNIKKEFADVHYTGNLAATIKIYQTENGWAVEIPAERYSFAEYQKAGVIVPYEKGGSYASSINKTGGFSGKHKGYVEKCIEAAIHQWMTRNHIQGRMR